MVRFRGLYGERLAACEDLAMQTWNGAQAVEFSDMITRVAEASSSFWAVAELGS